MSSFKKYSFKAPAAVMAMLMAPVLMIGASANAKEWTGWNIHVEDYPVSHGMEAFAKEISEKTDGRLGAKVFHGGVLGSQPDAIEQTRLGIINFGVFSLGPMGQAVPGSKRCFPSVYFQRRRPDAPSDGWRCGRSHRQRS